MIGKAGLVAVIVVSAVASGRQVDMRGLYDQMYPVSTLRRDALNLCHESDPTFIRASHTDRQACYTGMPHAIALALGFIHPSSALSGLFAPAGGLMSAGSLIAEAGFASQAVMSRQPPLSTPKPTPCREPVAGLAALPARSLDTAKTLDVLSGHRGTTALRPAAAPGVPAPSESLSLLDTDGRGDLADKTPAPVAGCATRS